MAKRKAVASPSSSPSESSESEDEEPTNGNEAASIGGELLDSDVSASSDELSTSSDSEHSSQPSQDIVNVDFEFFDPKPIDFHGVKGLLGTYLDDEVWDISGLVELILAQTTVGSVIKAEEDDNPIGVLTALNLARYQKSSCMVELHKFLRIKSAHKPESCMLEDFWGKHAKEVGLLVSERLVNIPIELAPPLYQGLFDEVLWATEDEPTQDLRDFFKFKHYLYLTRVFEELSKEDKKGEEQKKNQKSDVQETRELIYIKPEDEILHQLSWWCFSFPVSGESMAARQTEGMRQLRLVMAIEAKHVHRFKTQLKALTEQLQ